VETGQGEREYRVVGFQAYLSLIVLVILTAVGAPLLAGGAFRGSSGLFDLVWLALLAWFWFNALVRYAFRVRVSGDEVEFKSIARTRRTKLALIRSIRSRQRGVVTFRFDGGRVDVLGPLDGLHDFVSRVESANPGVQLRGV
jgi:hypothetical protein